MTNKIEELERAQVKPNSFQSTNMDFTNEIIFEKEKQLQSLVDQQ